MKRVLLVLVLTLLLVPAFAEKGFVFGADVGLSIALKPYVSESVGFKYQAENGFGVDGSLRVTENILQKGTEPFVYFLPCINLYYKSFYLGGGVILVSDFDSPVMPFGHLGFNVGEWQWGPGIGCVNLGLEGSPMLYYVDNKDGSASGGIGGAIASSLLTVFNIIKLNVGVTYFLPM